MQRDVYLVYIWCHLALHHFSSHSLRYPQETRSPCGTVALRMRHWHARHQPRIVTEVACDACQVFNCLVSKAYLLFCKKFWQTKWFRWFEINFSCFTSCQNTLFFLFFFNTGDIKLLKLVIKKCSRNSLCQKLNTSSKCFHSSEFAWSACCGSFCCMRL